jgi:pimeloyl-ACP methyl ester carboxylesterase/catechol 2,3-dioxygenase-like lactoylglutathione lyase family enzyme
MTTIDGIHHLKLPVSDVARSGAWYERVLGFETDLEFMEDGVLRGLALRHASGVGLALRHDPQRAAAMAGFDAFALAVPTRADVAAWERRLGALDEAHGDVLTGHRGGTVLVGLRDPDGIEIRLYSDETAAERSMAVDGGEITWTDTGGEGEIVLLVHAGVFGAWFDPLAAELRGHRVVTMRRAGYTGGGAPSRSLSMADRAAHCAALLDELGGRPATVVGHSSGSAIILQLAADRPDLVRRLVLVEPPLVDALADPADLPALHAAMGPVIGGAVGAAASGDLPAAYDGFMGLVCGPDHRAVVAAALGADGLDRAVRESAYFFADEVGSMAGWTFDAAKVDVPVLLVQGSDSPPPTHHLVAHLAGLLPDARVATVEGDNHLLPLRSPAELARLVTSLR